MQKVALTSHAESKTHWKAPTLHQRVESTEQFVKFEKREENIDKKLKRSTSTELLNCSFATCLALIVITRKSYQLHKNTEDVCDR